MKMESIRSPFPQGLGAYRVHGSHDLSSQASMRTVHSGSVLFQRTPCGTPDGFYSNLLNLIRTLAVEVCNLERNDNTAFVGGWVDS